MALKRFGPGYFAVLTAAQNHHRRPRTDRGTVLLRMGWKRGLGDHGGKREG
ncbi:MAG: hypothetical protein RL299_956 [Pseudomonadota bacterium]|jgi:hypothetical protein